MRIAILSDIRSNVYALQAVLDDIQNKNIDVKINLGNSFYGPIEPKKTYELIRKSEFINIFGIEDRLILEASLAQLEENKLLNFVYNDLNDDVLYWIQDLPFEKLIGEDFYMVNGTYYDDSKYLLEDVSSGVSTLRKEEDILKLMDKDIKSKFIMCGNSCIPRCTSLSNGQVILNPGSVGLQAFRSNKQNEHKIQNSINKACYIILDINNNEFNVELVKVDYDFESAALKASKTGFDDWAYALRNGKVKE